MMGQGRCVLYHCVTAVDVRLYLLSVMEGESIGTPVA